MPETGTNILSYHGDAALGLGANASIPAINPNADLKLINDTASQLQYYNHANNIRLYEQKVADRDKTLQMIADGEVVSGNIDPDDRKYYDEAKKTASDNFYDMIKNGGLNNPDAVRKYRESVTNLKNVATWAQHRELGLTQLQAEKAQQSIPEDIKMYDDHIQKMKKQSFWNPINPIQKAFDYNLSSLTSEVQGMPVTESQIGTPDQSAGGTGVTQWNTVTDKNGVITKRQTTRTAPVRSGLITNAKGGKGITTTGTQVNHDGSLSPISFTPEKYWDLPTLQQNVDELSVSNPSNRYAYSRFLNDFDDKLPIDQQISTLKGYNNRIAEYSTQRGIQPIGTWEKDTPNEGQPKYPDQVKSYVDPVSKKVLIQETPESFFAKHALASVNGDYVEKPQSIFNKDIGAYNVNKQRADTDEFYKHAMAGAAQTKARAYAANLHQQMMFRKTAAEQDNFLDELWQRNLVQQPTLIKGGAGNTAYLAPIQADNSLPVFTLSGKTPIQLQPIGAKAHNDIRTGKFQYWEGGHYDPEYILNGNILQPQQIADLYGKFKKTAGSGWTGGIDDYIKEAVKNNLFDYRLKGANGATDRGLSNAAQRIISNQSTKKGQVSVFDTNVEQPPLDESGVSEGSSSSSSETNINPN